MVKIAQNSEKWLEKEAVSQIYASYPQIECSSNCAAIAMEIKCT